MKRKTVTYHAYKKLKDRVKSLNIRLMGLELEVGDIQARMDYAGRTEPFIQILDEELEAVA